MTSGALDGHRAAIDSLTSPTLRLRQADMGPVAGHSKSRCAWLPGEHAVKAGNGRPQTAEAGARPRSRPARNAASLGADAEPELVVVDDAANAGSGSAEAHENSIAECGRQPLHELQRQHHEVRRAIAHRGLELETTGQPPGCHARRGLPVRRASVTQPSEEVKSPRRSVRDRDGWSGSQASQLTEGRPQALPPCRDGKLLHDILHGHHRQGFVPQRCGCLLMRR